MKQVNPEHINSLLKLINGAPYFELLSMKVCALGAGFSKVEADIKRNHYNPFGTVHGGVYSSLIDTAAYWSAYCGLDEGAGFTSIDLAINNLSMVREGKITAQGKSIKIGRSICLTEAYITDDQGKLLAHGTSKLMILNGKQSIGHAAEAAGYGPLPPKFI